MTQKIWELLTRSNGLSYRTMLISLAASVIAGVFLFLIYRLAAKNSFYVRSFGVTLAGVCVLTTAIILAMQSSLVVSLGMVGALSIVRFRTAIKDPFELMFLFWSVSSGIIAGTQLYALLAIVSVVMTVIVFALEKAPLRKNMLVMVFHADSVSAEKTALETVGAAAPRYRVRSRNLTGTGLDVVLEFRSSKEDALIEAVSAIEGVKSCSILTYDGDVRHGD